MGRCISSVAVFGLGKVGELVATLLTESGFEVRAYDVAPRPGVAARPLDVRDATALAAVLGDVDAVISCLPYHRNIAVAEAAAATATHYFDLTEDVPTTNRVMELAALHDGAAFAPQCGLAPGLIGIVGSSIAGGFERAPLRRAQGRCAATTPHRAARLRVQLVSRRCGQRVPQ